MEERELLPLIPKVDKILAHPEIQKASKEIPHPLLISQVRQLLSELRDQIREGSITERKSLELQEVVSRVLKRLSETREPNLKKVVNATGVVVHTNLGRSPLPRKVMEALMEIACGYSNLEYNLNEGKRGNRFRHVEDLLRELTGAEAGTVVNNNAAAVLLALDTVAKGKEVVVSRGELIEIGGSFRIPEVMKRSGARLVEVGTTNKTKLRDYEEAIGPETGLLLKVHTSNYKIVGFTESVPGNELVSLGRKYSIPVMEDLGSGCFVDLSQYGYEKEPTVQEVISQGMDIVTFSGDKLLGGPQAGIILGKREYIDRIRKNQLARAVRIDKLTLFCLEATLRIYLDPARAKKEIPTLRMVLSPYEELKGKAKKILKRIGRLNSPNFEISLLDGVSKVGGGALPGLNLRTAMIGLVPKRLNANELEKFLRGFHPPVITRIERDMVVMDVRTILDEDERFVIEAIKAASAL